MTKAINVLSISDKLVVKVTEITHTSVTDYVVQYTKDNVPYIDVNDYMKVIKA